jgi:hypothetical protein
MGAAPPNPGTREALVPSSRGLSLLGLLRASATLDQTETYSLAVTWQIAFLGEAEPRAARPGRLPGE